MAPPAADVNWAQSQPITTALSQICESYPAGTCLRELLQNADDAEATEIEYVLDTNTYNEGPLLYDSLQQFQGPALLVRNNKTFSDKDFASLSNIGNSRKRHDAAATGKFGQGFNSCYHWTDGPWIYSRQWLLLLDPHESWSKDTIKPGGPAWDVVKAKDAVEIQNHLKTFSAFSLDTTMPLDVTIIRIPLRTEAQAPNSLIVTREVTVQHIQDALKLLGREVRQGGLLFLKYVRKIIVRVDNELMWEARMEERNPLHPSVRNELTRDFRALYMPQTGTTGPHKVSKSFTVDMIFKEGVKAVSTSYLLHHLMQRSSGDEVLDLWARSKKLFPWVAVAAPLKDLKSDEPFNGRLFTVLRLPLETNQPVHIHGLFSITPDRGRLSSSGQTPGYEDMEMKWNTFMFEECIAQAWAALLENRNATSWTDEQFALWPRVELFPTELWTKLDDFILRKVFCQNLKVWNTAHCCIAASEGLFISSDGDIAKTYSQALKNVQLPVVYLKPSLLGKAQNFAKEHSNPLQQLTPDRVRLYLRHNQSMIPEDVSQRVLEYCLLDALEDNATTTLRRAIYEDLKTIRLWPTIKGDLKNLADDALMLPRDDEELSLFASSRPEITINIDRISDKVMARVKYDVALGLVSALRFRAIADIAVDWPRIYSVSEAHILSTQNSKPRLVENDELIRRAWVWIESRFRVEKKLPSELQDLWLLPLNGDLVRRFMPGLHCQPMLLVEKTDVLYRLMDLDALSNSEHTVTAQILDCHLLPVEAVRLLRQQAAKTPALHAASSNNLESLAHWLAANVVLVSHMTETHKKGLLHELERLARLGWLPTSSFTMEPGAQAVARLLKHLPLFNQQVAEAPYKAWVTKRSDMQPNTRNVQLPQGLPPICPTRDLRFYETSEPSGKYLIATFKLLENISLEEVLFQHVLPQVLDHELGSREEMIASLSKFILEKSSEPEHSWVKELKRFPVIPLKKASAEAPWQFRRLEAVIDPTSALAKLYFESEEVFPDEVFFKQHQLALSACGLPKEVNCQVVLERAQYYSTCSNLEQLLDRVNNLLGISIDPEAAAFRSSRAEIIDMPWLPAWKHDQTSLTLLPPSQCRGADEAKLVDCVLGVINTKAIRAPWKRLFGWDKPIDKRVLNEQLDVCLKERRHESVNAVLQHIRSEDSSLLQEKQCIFSRRQNYIYPHQGFLPGSILETFPLFPYLEEIDDSFAGIHSSLLRSLGILSQPSLGHILEVQNMVSASTENPLEDDAQLNTVINTLEIASRLCKGEEIAQCKAPDTQGKLLPIHDLVYGDRSIGATNAEFNFVHPAVSERLIVCLGIEAVADRIIRLQIEIHDEDDDEYVPSERLTTIIEDTLGRYPILSTFSEFLSNAEDCHASKISWILDRCDEGPYKSESLLTPETKVLQGAALYAHNDKTFTAQDFEGYKDIGRGGKSEDINSIGIFGRGSMSMYHFTNNPMILSDKWLLILDPHQQLLVRNKFGKRKPGVKMPLETVRRLFKDQLRPFHGLCGYSMEADNYPGTLFRMPLKGATDTGKALSGVKVCELFEEYHDIARESLLFLKHVRSISFSVLGQAKSGWSIIAKHPDGAEHEIFQQIKLTGSKGGESSFDEVWRVGMTDLVQSPPNIPTPVVGKLKIVECGVAACLPQPAANIKNTGRLGFEGKFHNKLPTTYNTEMPVALHATFAVTGDRRTISVDDGRDPNASWNHWLLSTCIPEFYIEFLRDLALKMGPASFEFWPSKTSNGIAGVVQKSFWEKVFNNPYKVYQLYPLVDVPLLPSRSTLLRSRNSGRRKLSSVANLECSEFDFLGAKVSSLLQPLLATLCPGLVRPPLKLRRHFLRDLACGIKMLDASYLSGLFREEKNCKFLEEFLTGLPREGEKSKTKALEMLLLEIVPNLPGDDKTPLHILDGSRILPKLDGSLAVLKLNSQSTPLGREDWILVPTREEFSLFNFAIEFFVDTSLFTPPVSGPLTTLSLGSGTRRNVIKELRDAGFNIRSIPIEDIGKLVVHSKSPLGHPETSLPGDDWFSRLWTYLNRRVMECEQAQQNHDSLVNNFNIKAGLQDCRIYRIRSGSGWHYLTLTDLMGEPFVIQPDDPEHFRICSEIDAIKIVERHHVPFPWASAERTFKDAPALTRLFLAFQKIGERPRTSITALLNIGFSTESVETLRGLVLESTTTGNQLQGQKVLRDIALWPRNSKTLSNNSTNVLAIRDAVFCTYSQLLVPWTRDLNQFVDPSFFKLNEFALASLGVQSSSAGTIWKERIEPYLPQKLETDSFAQYHEMITCLSAQRVQSSAKIAPNGNGFLCAVDSLYDHDEALFVAAFRDPHQQRIRFVDPEFRNLRPYWIKHGLRIRSSDVVTADDYLECVRAMEARVVQSSADVDFSMDARKVAGYLTYEKSSFHTWSSSTWNQISRIKMFEAKISFPQDCTYRRSRVQELALAFTHRSLRETGMRKYRRMLWSQLPCLYNPPADYIYSQIPECNKPSVKAVYNHLLYLMEIRVQVQTGEVAEFLMDVQSCYDFLQSNLTQSAVIAGIRQARIWLNFDTTDVDSVSTEQIQSSITVAERLCINSVAEPHPYKNTLKFLSPYEKLLKALGVQALVVRKIEIHENTQPKESPSDYIAKNHRELRNEGNLLDVVFEAEGNRIAAHKTAMAGASPHLKAQFSGNWAAQLAQNGNIVSVDMKYATLSRIVDFAYDGTVSWTPLPAKPTNDEIANRLDELLDLLRGSDMWGIGRLHDITEHVLLKDFHTFVRPDNVDDVREEAKGARALKVEKACGWLIEDNPDFVRAFREESMEVDGDA